MESSGKNTGVGCHFLLQGIFLTQGLNMDPCITGTFFTCHEPWWSSSSRGEFRVHFLQLLLRVTWSLLPLERSPIIILGRSLSHSASWIHNFLIHCFIGELAVSSIPHWWNIWPFTFPCLSFLTCKMGIWISYYLGLLYGLNDVMCIPSMVPGCLSPQ